MKLCTRLVVILDFIAFNFLQQNINSRLFKPYLTIKTSQRRLSSSPYCYKSCCDTQLSLMKTWLLAIRDSWLTVDGKILLCAMKSCKNNMKPKFLVCQFQCCLQLVLQLRKAEWFSGASPNHARLWFQSMSSQIGTYGQLQLMLSSPP